MKYFNIERPIYNKRGNWVLNVKALFGELVYTIIYHPDYTYLLNDGNT